MFILLFIVVLGVVPDGASRAPGDLGLKLGEIIGYVKFLAYGMLVLALIGVAVEIAFARSQGSAFAGSGGLLRVLVAVAVVSGAASIIELLV